jgi:hypothetical protein
VIAAGDATGPDSDVAAPLLDSTLGTLDGGLKNWRLELLSARIIDRSTTNVRIAQLSIGAADVQVPVLLGDVLGGETASNPGPVRFNGHGYDYFLSKNSPKNVKLHTTFSDTSIEYFGKAFIWDTNAVPFVVPTSEDDSTAHWTPTDCNRTTARLTTPAYSDGERALLIADLVMSQSHAVVGMATGAGALLAVIREERDSENLPIQYADPQVEGLKSTRTLIESGASSYLQNGQEKATGWSFAPSYADGVAMSKSSAEAFDGEIHMRLGEAGSGLLRKNLAYEFGYSIYDATTATETNACEPFRFETSSDDLVAISVFRNQRAGGINSQRLGWGMNVPVQKPHERKINYIQYRFYYRAFGSQEWLPALHIWAADYLFNGTNDAIWAAQAAMGATIGGAAGQFNDFSSLPKENWKDVVIFQNRFFWCSEKQAIFSLRNNAFSYPIRNSISLPSGEFRGVTVHVYYGQSQQNGRVVFWATDAQYEGRFTGNPTTYPVSVTPDFIGQFALDGSDFVVQFRSSITAFSSKAAVVAEGTLFFWGESGIYADSGVNPPNKISGSLEPWLGGIFDPTQTSKIHCVYNDKTKEIVWFYIPLLTTEYVSEALVFNADKNAFFRYGFQTSIDWSQTINLSQEGARKRLSCGKRLLIGHSFALYPQRTCFFDEKNQTGDIKHGREFLVKEITALAAGTRLVLASGFDLPVFADVAVGDEFLVSQAFDYTESDSAYNNRYAINDIGNYYFDIAETLEAATFSQDKYLPIWIDKYANIPFRLRTRYLMPGDRWTVYSYSWLAMSLRIPGRILQDFEAGVFSNLNDTATFQTVTMAANATQHCIRPLSFSHNQESTDGIGFGVEMKGNANGASWRMDWLGIVGRDIEDLTRFGQGD